MKLRDLVANSLPRVRGRKKKGQTVSSTAASVTAVVVAAVATTTKDATTTAPSSSSSLSSSPAKTQAALNNSRSPTSPQHRHDNNGNWFQLGESRFSFLEKLVGKESPVKRLFEPRERHAASATKVGNKRNDRVGFEEKKSKSQQGLAFHPSSNPYGSVEVVTSCAIEDRPVFYSQHTSPVCRSWLENRERAQLSDSSDPYASALGYPESATSYGSSSTPCSQRGPRSRSRIRTNPWLPSPRPSPYSVRSLSSPCASSRSQSPSSSPSPNSSSESASPLTSFSSDVSQSQLLRHNHHRRHRRHHSEIKASELTGQALVEGPLTDSEQYYYSTVDSGVCDLTPASGERDRRKGGTGRRQRQSTSKRRSAERDVPSYLTSPPAQSSSSSSSPRSRAKLRARTRSSHPPCKGRIANRDSRSWDSDSSSRSPPRTSRTSDSRHSSYFESTDYEIFSPFDRRWSDHSLQRGDVQVLRCGSNELLSESVFLDFSSRSEFEEPSFLSPNDDICVITSNIEQLAHNISSEYEDSGDVSFASACSSLKREDRCASLRDLLNIDADENALFHREGESRFGSCLNYTAFSEALQQEECVKRCSQDTLLDNTLTDISGVDPVLGEEELSTADVAVQTDFDEDEEEEEDEHSSSEVLCSAESSSEWVTSSSDWATGNGSSSDWPIRDSSGGDWQAGERSGCATEAEDVEEDEEEEEEEEGEALICEEGSRVWIVPDIMHNSTDTGYSSLSRDGRIVPDRDNNNNNNSNNNNLHPRNTEDSSSDSAGAEEEKGIRVSLSVSHRSENPAEGSVQSHPAESVLAGAERLVPRETSFSENLLGCEESLCSLRRVCGVDSFPAEVELEKDLDELSNASEFYPCLDHVSEMMSATAPGERSRRQFQDTLGTGNTLLRCQDYNNVIPYPYDVTRFGDLALPSGKEERGRSVSPCFIDDVSAGWPRTAAPDRAHTPTLLPLSSSTPRYVSSDVSQDDICSCFPDVVTSLDLASISNSGKEGGLGSCLCDGSEYLQPGGPWDNNRRGTSQLVPASGRSLQEVRVSLQNKVQVLRQGRRLVSRKIREAREEEMMRQQQKLRLQHLLDIHRKRILLDTLQDLRQRLESQSERLQATYSTVLNLQKRYV